MKRHASRRSFLKAIGAGSALLPLLESRRAGAATTVPKRLIIVSTTDGMYAKSFWPTGAGANFTIDPAGELSGLIPNQKDILILRGVDMTSYNDDKYNTAGHGSYQHYLTGQGGPPIPFQGGQITVPTTASIDQVIADAVIAANPHLPVSALTLSVRAKDGGPQQRMCWRAGSVQVSPEGSPYRLFNTLFGNAGTQGADVTQLLAERRSVLDFVSKRLTAYTKDVSSADQLKVQQHLAGVREIERQLDPNNATAAACAPPTLGGLIDVESSDNYPQVGDLQMKMIAAAFACDSARVATLQWGDCANSDLVFSWLGQEFLAKGDGTFFGLVNQHQIAHNEGQASYTPLKIKSDTWYWSQLASLIKYLKSYPEGNGTVFDNTLIVWGNMMSDGGAHSTTDMPYILAGGAAGAITTGRYLQLVQPKTKGIPHNRLLTFMANYMGVAMDHFGDPAYAGPALTLTA